MLGIVAVLAQEPPLTVAGLPSLVRQARSDQDKEALAERVRRWFGGADKMGGTYKSDGTHVLWAVQSDKAPTVSIGASDLRQIVRRIGKTNVWTIQANLRDGDAGSFELSDCKTVLGKGLVEVYIAEPETRTMDGVPKGTTVAMPKLSSHVFEGTTRDWWVYTPPGLASGEEAALMVFQDGQRVKDWVPTVFDNCIAKGWMPKTVAVFIPPGTFEGGRSDRSFEYDTLSDAYVRFVTEEVLPEVQKMVTLSADPAKRAICGMSSGGICAFTAAWQRPDQFGKVMSFIGSFTNIASGASKREGGHNYPALIRKTDAKPIRVFLQDGRNDLDNEHGNWPLANQSMAAALAFKKYDYRFDFANGNHSDRYARAHLPSLLKWLWR